MYTYVINTYIYVYIHKYMYADIYIYMHMFWPCPVRDKDVAWHPENLLLTDASVAPTPRYPCSAA